MKTSLRESILRQESRKVVTTLGKLVAKNRPESKALIAARRWWKSGTQSMRLANDRAFTVHPPRWRLCDGPALVLAGVGLFVGHLL